MKADLHERLILDISKLKKITLTLSFESLINFVSTHQNSFNSYKSLGLDSPFQQGTYLLGIASSQEEPASPVAISDNCEKNICKLLNDIFNAYAFNYFEKGQNNLVVMSVFIHYFFTTMTFNSTQTKEWIKFWFLEYSKVILREYGFNVEDLLELGEVLENEIQKNISKKREVIDEIELSRQEFLKQCDISIDNYDIEIKKIRNNKSLQDKASSIFEKIEQMYSVEYSDILKRFDKEKLDKILALFSLERGSSKEITYITDENPIASQPLLLINNRIYFVINNSFYISIINFLEKELYKKNKQSQKLVKNRDKKLESKSVDVIRSICSSDAKLFESAYENENSTNEHDLVVYDRGTILIVEAKASPPREPMRDTDKAYNKLKDHFRSDSGIQKGFTQARSLERRIRDEMRIKLYDKKGKVIFEKPINNINSIYKICITRNDFGALGCNLNYLLEKDDEESYPWVIDIANLEAMSTVWNYLELESNNFYEYIDSRIKLHGKVVGIDELEYVGAYLSYEGGLNGFLTAKADFISLDMSHADIFDDIYLSNLRGQKYILKKKPFDFVSFNSLQNTEEIAVNSAIYSNNKKLTRKSKNRQQRKSRKNNRK